MERTLVKDGVLRLDSVKGADPIIFGKTNTTYGDLRKKFDSWIAGQELGKQGARPEPLKVESLRGDFLAVHFPDYRSGGSLANRKDRKEPRLDAVSRETLGRRAAAKKEAEARETRENVQGAASTTASVVSYAAHIPVLGWAVKGAEFIYNWVSKATKESEETNTGIGTQLAKNFASSLVETFVVKPVKSVVNLYYWLGLNKVFGPTEPGKREIAAGEFDRGMKSVREEMEERNYDHAKADAEMLMKRDLAPAQKAEARSLMDGIELAKAGRVFPLLYLIPGYVKGRKEKAEEKIRKNVQESAERMEALARKLRTPEEENEFRYRAAYVQRNIERLTPEQHARAEGLLPAV